MFRVSLVASLGLGSADDAASLLQKRSRNDLVSAAGGAIDSIKQSALTQLDEAVTGKQCKNHLESEGQLIGMRTDLDHKWNAAHFDGLERSEETSVTLACPTQTLCSGDDPCQALPEKTCKDKKEVVEECTKATKKSCEWLKDKAHKIRKDRENYAKKIPSIDLSDWSTNLKNQLDRKESGRGMGDGFLIPDCKIYEATMRWAKGDGNWNAGQIGLYYDELFQAYGNVADQLNFYFPSQHTGAELPLAIRAFYGAVVGLQGAEALTALDMMNGPMDAGRWAHTGHPTAIGKEQIAELFQKVHSDIASTTTLQAISTSEAHEHVGTAASYVVRRCSSNDECKRDAFVLNGEPGKEKINLVWTTNAHEDDLDFGGHMQTVAGGEAQQSDGPAIVILGATLVDEVQKAIEVYFNGFVGHNASMMQSAYHQSNPLFMADFDPERKAPYPCSASEDCGTAPLIHDYDDLLPAFEAFVQQPSHIQLNREFTPAGVFGDFAYVSTVSYGCEGNMVTPEGAAPAPNRELFVATRTDADGWKIRFYMFSIDPKSPISPPVEICDLNRDTPGSVWPSE